MPSCVFCTEASFATTATTTTMDAFPFLCAQVGVAPRTSSPAELCSTCHSAWEEVTLLYANVQGLLNLIGRRVTDIKKRVKDCDLNSPKGKRPRQNVSGPGPEKMMNWWYPVSPKGPTDNTDPHEPAGSDDSDIKMESVEVDDGLDAGGDLEFEDVEIIPDNEDHDEDSNIDDEWTARPNSFRKSPRKLPNPQTSIPQSHGEIQILTSRKDRPLLSLDGNLFQLDKKASTKMFWRCAQFQKYKCKCRIHTSVNLSKPALLLQVGEHNHEPKSAACEVKKVMTKILQAASSSSISAEQLIANEMQQMPDGSVGHMPKPQSIKRSIRRVRGRRRGHRF